MQTRPVDSETPPSEFRPQDEIACAESNGDDERKEMLVAVRHLIASLSDAMEKAGRNANLVWPIFRDCFANFGDFCAVARMTEEETPIDPVTGQPARSQPLCIGYPKALEVGLIICGALNTNRLGLPVEEEAVRDVKGSFATALNPVFEINRKEPGRVMRILYGEYIDTDRPALEEVCRECKIHPRQGRRILARIRDALPSIR